MAKLVYIISLALIAASLHSQGLDTNFMPSKTWWAKKVTDEFYTAGRLSESQYKYASEVGFKTILSNFNYAAPDFIGKEELPAYRKAKNIVTNLSGIQFKVVLRPGQSWASVDAVQSLAKALEGAPRPILYHCGSATSATFMLLNHLANVSRLNPDTRPLIDSMEVYKRGAAQGYDFSSDQLKKVVSDVTGEPVVKNPPKPEESMRKPMWLLKPLAKNWYVAGQFQSNYMAHIKTAGFKSVVNTRKGLTTSGMPSQEEVNLLNIKDNTGTYKKGGRQSRARLEETRLDKNKKNEYINEGSRVNYAARNFLQFGDDIGYNENSEKFAVVSTDLAYHHTPIGGRYGYTVEMYRAYKPILQLAVKKGPVLVQSRSGLRAIVLAALAAGEQLGKNSAWAIRRCWEHGYEVSNSNKPEIIKLFQDVLDKPALYTTM